jgi:hypothetical protein
MHPFQIDGRWYSCFRDHQGEHRHVVLPAKTRVEAEWHNGRLQAREDRARALLEADMRRRRRSQEVTRG